MRRQGAVFSSPRWCSSAPRPPSRRRPLARSPVILDNLAAINAVRGRFFTIFAGADANGDGNPNADRLGLEGRNSLEGPGYRSVDVRVAREFPLGGRVRGEVSLDVFNLFDRTNVRDLNTVWGSFNPNVAPIASYNTVRDVFNPRQAQVGRG